LTVVSEQFVERLGAALTAMGMPALPSRVFAALLSDADGRMTAQELVDALHVSRGGVSGAVRYLEQTRLLRRERERGGRRDVYVVEDDAWRRAMVRQDQANRPLLEALDDELATLSPDDGSYRRMLLTREFLVFTERETRAMAQRWDRHRRRLERDLGGSRP
jgi:DNA-binding transcriptional regulator GbsR (MarR family)